MIAWWWLLVSAFGTIWIGYGLGRNAYSEKEVDQMLKISELQETLDLMKLEYEKSVASKNQQIEYLKENSSAETEKFKSAIKTIKNIINEA